MPERESIFVSYSHKDQRSFEEFRTMLAPAVRKDKIELWSDTQIETGALWKEDIAKQLATASIAVLLVSPAFLASDFIAKQELPPLLKRAKDDGLLIFWVYISACLYEQTEIEDYQAAHDVSRPLNKLTKPQRQQAWSEICSRLVGAAATRASSTEVAHPATGSADGSFPDQPFGDRLSAVECRLLLREAASVGLLASCGCGSSTVFHRQLDLAERWLNEAKKWLDAQPEAARTDVGGDRRVIDILPLLISESRLWLPKPGETSQDVKKPRTVPILEKARTHAEHLDYFFKREAESDAELQALLSTDRKWYVLGFDDKADYERYLFPRVEDVVSDSSPMQVLLLEALLNTSSFTPQELIDQGYSPAIVMDTVNALLREKWAKWVDLSVLGSAATGALTDVGKRLLRELIAKRQVTGTA